MVNRHDIKLDNLMRKFFIVQFLVTSREKPYFDTSDICLILANFPSEK